MAGQGMRDVRYHLIVERHLPAFTIRKIGCDESGGLSQSSLMTLQKSVVAASLCCFFRVMDEAFGTMLSVLEQIGRARGASQRRVWYDRVVNQR
ncbi:hypothetical protein WS48_04325 [Burkholderia sp. RF7-non_BP1]|nr:hypothetical protein WS45_28420 [Burkholderia sp. RF2-non_BP3]KUY81441.1 hypothetical protein WS46_16660 [Burkholderia sp. RF4-BP95]KUY96689.1 hypothetical protein WS49_22545 [Burkholderia sp. RF7-non_BP4]KUZ02904.1 hypothetical protein WS48_04325 [Burkholderia sp. RF7-non_BP1]